MATIQMTRAEYEARYGKPVPQPVVSPAPVPTQQPAAPVTTMTRAEYEAKFGKGKDGKLKKQSLMDKLVDAGKGAGAAIGEAAIGAVQLPFKALDYVGDKTGAPDNLFGAIDDKLQNAKEQAYTKPSEEARKTTSGKIGYGAGTIAPYLIPGGVIGSGAKGAEAVANADKAKKVTDIVMKTSKAKRIAGIAAKDSLISASQTGDKEATAATGITSAVAEAVLGNKAKVAKGVFPAVKNVAKNVVPGYVADVSSGLAGQRGEDRTGKKAFIPGFGTALAGTLATAPLIKKGISNVADSASTYAYEKAITPNAKDAEKIFNTSVKTPFTKRMENFFTYGENITTPTPMTRAETAKKYNIWGTGKGIGVKAQRKADEIYTKQIGPTIKKMSDQGIGTIARDELYTSALEKINKVTDPIKKQRLIDALDYVQDSYKDGLPATLDLELQQALKRDIADFTPQAIFKGKDVSNELAVIKDLIAKKIRSNTYEAIPMLNLKEKYLDYGNLVDMKDVAIKDIQDTALKGGSGGLVSGAFHAVADPFLTFIGSGLNKVSKMTGQKGYRQLPMVADKATMTSQATAPQNMNAIDNTITETGKKSSIMDKIRNTPNKKGGFITIPGVKAKNIHPEDAETLRVIIDTPSLDKLNWNDYLDLEKLSQRFNISLDQPFAKIKQKLQAVLDAKIKVNGTLLPGSLPKRK